MALSTGLPAPQTSGNLPWEMPADISAPVSQPGTTNPTPNPTTSPPSRGGFGATPQGQAIQKAESGERNIPNYAFDKTHTAGGYYQITDTNWQHYAPQLGIDTSKYPNALSAPEAIQGQVAGKMYAETGIMPWSGNAKLSQVWSTFTPEEQKAMKARTAASHEASASMVAFLQEHAALANAAPEGSKERDEAIAQLRANSAEMMKDWRQKVMNPPMAKPVDAWQNMASPGFILAALAGLFSRQHMTAGLTAAGNALNAINQNSKEEYERQTKMWHDQVSLGAQMISMENESIRSLIEDKHEAIADKQAKLQTMAIEFGLVNQIGQNNLGNIDAQLQLLGRREQALDSFNRSMAIAQVYANGRGAKISAPKEFEVTTTDGKTEKVSLEQGVKPGTWFDPTTGEQVDASKFKSMTPITAAAGRQEATQINALVGSTNEAVGDLKNLMELPIGATTGIFAGVQSERPRDLAAAWRHSLASNMTSDEAKDVIVTAQGIQREMATIEAQGRATGLVGLTSMANSLIPQSGDSGDIVLRKYAQIRQIAERNIETIINRSNVDPKQKALLEKNLEEIKKAVPFTVHDVTTLERAAKSGNDETVAEYATRMFGGKAETAPAGAPAGSKKVGTYQGKAVWEFPDGSRHVEQP